MPPRPKPINHYQTTFDFDNPTVEEARWPLNEKFPLNRKWYGGKTTVLEEIVKDIAESDEYLVVTGFTSLAHVIMFFGHIDYQKTKKIRIVLGFEPELRKRRVWKTAELSKEIKDYWADLNYSLLNGGEVIRTIELIKNGTLLFKFSDKQHAKIYVGSNHAILGSANFSRNGVTTQKEANIRLSNLPANAYEHQQYIDIQRIAENFYQEARDYNQDIISLLQELLKLTTWQEALARAIAELIERQWIKDLPDLQDHINSIKLWPSQRLGLGQSLYILQTQGCVLIADPTGSGKTKMISTLQMVLFHWLWETGRKNKCHSLTICPPLVLDSWKREFSDIRFQMNSHIAMSSLSNKNGNSYLNSIKEVKQANVLVIDEAHNFLRPGSNRSNSIAEALADNIILSTATPISKRVKDLLRLIELLGVDNLKDEELEEFTKLKDPRKSYKTNAADLNQLKIYISKFIVRRTKKDLNKLIDLAEDEYRNRQGNKCRYPVHECEIYKTGETEADKKLASEINDLSTKLKGIIYLQDLRRPDYEFEYSEADYLEKRLKASRALAIYNVQSKLRSSSAALIEHILGTEFAVNYFDFKTNKEGSGNVINTIDENSGDLPKNDFLVYSPDWLKKLPEYQVECVHEINTYKEIVEKAKKLSGQRELNKVTHLVSLFNKNKLALAFDSTVITLDYFNDILKKNFKSSVIKSYVVTGKTDKSQVHKVLQSFDLGSVEENCLAFCSDSMSEGVNLQQASALVFLDMPSVLRIAEQRIGRIDRLDSPHKKVHIYWPNDSQEFALRTDLKLIKTSIDTETLIGSNFKIPKEILDRHLDEVVTAKTMIEAYKEEHNDDFLWDGLQDAFRSVHNLYDGEDPLIDRSVYQTYRDVESAVKVKLSIGKSSAPWLFLAVKGNKEISSRWYFVDDKKEVHQDLNVICNQLRQRLTKGIEWTNEWTSEVKRELDEYFKILQENERSLLPPKRQRALKVAQIILEKRIGNKSFESQCVPIAKELLKAFTPQDIDQEYSIDYYQFSQQWLDVLMPYVYDIKKKQRRSSKEVISLNSLIKNHHSILLTLEILEKILNNIPIVPNVWNRVAACIICIPE